METLGEFVRRRRDILDISLRELAKRAGITPPFLSDLELGRRNPSEEVLKTLAKELGVSEEELRKRDVRAPIDDIKRITLSDPQFAMAFRTVVDKNISAQDLLAWAQKQARVEPKKK
jgi:transcriptional regulator with XRE-family HTH domain